jgi:hypothetical protein
VPLPPLDPNRPPSGDPGSRVADRLAALERRLRTLEGMLSGGATQQIPVVDNLPPAGRLGRLVVLAGDSRVFRDTGSSWVAVG